LTENLKESDALLGRVEREGKGYDARRVKKLGKYKSAHKNKADGDRGTGDNDRPRYIGDSDGGVSLDSDLSSSDEDESIRLGRRKVGEKPHRTFIHGLFLALQVVSAMTMTAMSVSSGLSLYTSLYTLPPVRVVVLVYTALGSLAFAVNETEYFGEIQGLGNWGVRGLVYVWLSAVNEEGVILDGLNEGGGREGTVGVINHVMTYVVGGMGCCYVAGWIGCCRVRRDKRREKYHDKIRRWKRRVKNAKG